MHIGILPGYSTRISFIPSDGIAVVTLINAHGKTLGVTAPLLYKIIHELAIANNTSVDLGVGDGFERPAGPPSITLANMVSTNASLPLSLDAYTGNYRNAGYGSFTICAPSSTASDQCVKVLSDFAKVDMHNLGDANVVPSASSDPAVLQLFAAFPRVWGSHLRFVHIDRNKFTFDTTTLFVEGYGANKTPFEVSAGPPAVAEFAVDEESGEVRGFGLVGTVLDRLTDRQRKGGSVYETADAWFDRV